MGLLFLFKGLLLGFSVAAPVGPIGVLCIRRTLARGRASGFVSGLGAASADTLYGTIAAFGLTAISSFLINYTIPLRIIGGLFLLYLGLKIFFSKAPANNGTNKVSVNLWGDYFSILLLTITNPTTILSFIAMFTGIGLVGIQSTFFSATCMVAGVFLGSAFWWLLLSSIVHLLRAKFTLFWMNVVNKISGIIVIGFSIMAWMSLR
jgi:threonine/homoserine/homoserine lactone efflux protein